MDLVEILNKLKNLSKDELTFLVVQLMKDKKLAYQDITDCYVAFLEYQKKNISEEYQQLKSKVIEEWAEPKGKRLSKLKETMHYLLDKGQVNTTHEEINLKS